MSWLSVADPLALLALDTGQINSPTTGGAAKGTKQLDTAQRAAVLGEPVPVIFARWRNNAGGILISPPAAEARFENDTTNAVTASYALVLGQGQMDSLQVRDVFQGPCRVGSFSQAYDGRAGTWDPGNFIIDQSLPARRFFTTDIASLSSSADMTRWNLVVGSKLSHPITNQLVTYPFDAFSWYEATLVNAAKPNDYTSWTYKINGTTVAPTIVKGVDAVTFTTPVASTQCGTTGFYPGVSTLSFQSTWPDKNEGWKKQIHCFIRGGLWVPRLEDGVTGASDSFADLVVWLWRQTSRIPDQLIDTTAMTLADKFLRANGLTCNCELSTLQNAADFLAGWAKYFLLQNSTNGGMRGLRPMLPVNTDGTIKTTAVSPAYLFDESLIIPDSFEQSWISLADRLPFIVQVIWRQQPENDFGIIRTVEVSYDGTTGPKESHDLSAFCTSELHAVRVGAYILARRKYVTHTAKFRAAPDSHNALLSPGDVIRVKLNRAASGVDAGVLDYLYQIERITETINGDVTYECTHFPADDNLRSMVALDVAAVQPTGIILPGNQSGVSCDLNSSSDTTVPTSTKKAGNSSVGRGKVSVIPQSSYSGGGYGSTGGIPGGGGVGGGGDGLGDSGVTTLVSSNAAGQPTPVAANSILTAPVCPNGQTPTYKWYVNGVYTPNFQGGSNIIAPYYMNIQVGSNKLEVYCEVYCNGKLYTTSKEVSVPTSWPNGNAARYYYWQAYGTPYTQPGWFGGQIWNGVGVPYLVDSKAVSVAEAQTALGNWVTAVRVVGFEYNDGSVDNFLPFYQ